MRPGRRRFPIEAAQAYLFILPAIVIIGIFKVLPAIAVLYMSLFRWDVIQGAFRGLGNYTDWLYDNSLRSPDFWRSARTCRPRGSGLTPGPRRGRFRAAP